MENCVFKHLTNSLTNGLLRGPSYMESKAKVCAPFAFVFCDRKILRILLLGVCWVVLLCQCIGCLCEADVAREGHDLWWPCVYVSVGVNGMGLHQSFVFWLAHGMGIIICRSACSSWELWGLWALASGAHMVLVSVHVLEFYCCSDTTGLPRLPTLHTPSPLSDSY